MPGVVPTASMITAPTTKPMVVPPRARSAADPVVRAVVRSTDIAPSTTQKPCATSVTSAIVTAMASPDRPAHAVLEPHGMHGQVTRQRPADGQDLAGRRRRGRPSEQPADQRPARPRPMRPRSARSAGWCRRARAWSPDGRRPGAGADRRRPAGERPAGDVQVPQGAQPGRQLGAGGERRTVVGLDEDLAGGPQGGHAGVADHPLTFRPLRRPGQSVDHGVQRRSGPAAASAGGCRWSGRPAGRCCGGTAHAARRSPRRPRRGCGGSRLRRRPRTTPAAGRPGRRRRPRRRRAAAGGPWVATRTPPAARTARRPGSSRPTGRDVAQRHRDHDREDEGQQGRPRRNCQGGAEHAAEQDEESEQRHARDGQPGHWGHQGAERDENQSGQVEPGVGAEPGAAVAREIGEQQEGDRPERGEQGHLGVAQHGAGDDPDGGRDRDLDRLASGVPLDRGPASSRRSARRMCAACRSNPGCRSASDRRESISRASAGRDACGGGGNAV